jgi:hypothetical protein
LQKEYDFVGYPLYIALFVACIAGGGIGMIDFYKYCPSIRLFVPAVQKKLCGVSLVAHILFAAFVTFPILFSDFKLEGY